MGRQWKVGDVVEGNWSGKGRWFQAHVSAAHQDGMWDLFYEYHESWNETVSCVRHVDEIEESHSLEVKTEIHDGAEHKAHHKHRHVWRKPPADMLAASHADTFHGGEYVEGFSTSRQEWIPCFIL